MLNVINFPVSPRSTPVSQTAQTAGEVIPFPYELKYTDPDYASCVKGLAWYLTELKRAKAADDAKMVWEWRDEITTVKIQAGWSGYRDIVARCQTILAAH